LAPRIDLGRSHESLPRSPFTSFGWKRPLRRGSGTRNHGADHLANPENRPRITQNHLHAYPVPPIAIVTRFGTKQTRFAHSSGSEAAQISIDSLPPDRREVLPDQQYSRAASELCKLPKMPRHGLETMGDQNPAHICGPTPAPPDLVFCRAVLLARYGNRSAVRGEPRREGSPFGDHCPPNTEPSLPKKRDVAAGTRKPCLQVRTCGRSLPLQLGPLLPALRQVGVDIGLVIQIKCEGSIDVRRGQPLEIPADTLWRASLPRCVDD